MFLGRYCAVDHGDGGGTAPALPAAPPPQADALEVHRRPHPPVP
jgi:hypothetical protein